MTERKRVRYLLRSGLLHPVTMAYRMLVYCILPTVLFLILVLPMMICIKIAALVSGRRSGPVLCIVAPEIHRVGGYEMQIKVLSPYMGERFSRVWVLSNLKEDMKDLFGEGVHCENIGYFPRIPRSPVTIAASYLLFIIRKGLFRNCSVLIFAQSKFSSSISIASVLLGFPVISRIPSTKDFEILKSRHPEAILMSTSLRVSEKILCLNGHIEKVLHQWGFGNTRLIRWNNAVISAKDNQRIRRRGGRDRSAFIYAGRLDRHKNVDTLIRGIESVKARGGSVALHIYGDGEERGRLIQLARELEVDGLVTFKGVVDMSLVAWDYDAALLMSLSEGQSNFLLEAMARGLPVIASRVPGNVDIVSDGDNGFLVEPDDEVALADKIFLLLSDNTLSEKLGNNGYHYVKRHHSPEEISAQLFQLYGLVKGPHENTHS